LKRKRLLTLVGSICLVLVLAALLLPACAAEEAPAPAPTPTPTPTAEVFEWRFQTHWPTSSASYLPWKKWFEEDLLELTGGRVKITFHPAATFMPTTEMFDAWKTGMLDGGISFAPYYTSQVPLGGMECYFPYAFRDVREFQYFLHFLGFEEAIREAHLKHGILYWAGDGYPSGPIFKKPIRTIDDLQGIKIRATGALADWYAEAGASPVMIPGGEIYTALSTGVVDAAIWGGAAGSYSMKFYEVAKYYMQPYAGMATDNVYISKKAWDKLPADLQDILRHAIELRYWMRTTEYFIDVEAPALQAMVKDHGVEIVWIDEAGQKALMDAALKVWDETAAKGPELAHWVGMLKDFNKKLGYMD